MKKFLALSLSDVVFIMLVNVKIPTTIGIVKSMSRINFVLGCVEHQKSFITLVLDFAYCLNKVKMPYKMSDLV